MRRWTVIFRGNYFRVIRDAVIRIYRWIEIIVRLEWQFCRYTLRIIFFIVGINWFELERLIERKIRRVLHT